MPQHAEAGTALKYRSFLIWHDTTTSELFFYMTGDISKPSFPYDTIMTF